MIPQDDSYGFFGQQPYGYKKQNAGGYAHWASHPGLPAGIACCLVVLIVVAGGVRWAGAASGKESIGTQGSFQCDVAAPEEISTWVTEQRVWCCVNANVGCPYKVCHSSDLVNVWTEEQRRFCCQMEGLGCPSTTHHHYQPLPYDCLLGPGGADEWEEEKRAFCCHYSLRGCPTRTSTTTIEITFTETITTTTAQPTIMVPFPACSPEDVNCVTLYPTPLPLLPTTTTLAYDAYAAAAAAQGGHAMANVPYQAAYLPQ